MTIDGLRVSRTGRYKTRDRQEGGRQVWNDNFLYSPIDNNNNNNNRI